MTGGGGQLKRAKETLTLEKPGSLWTVLLGCVTSGDVGDRLFDGKDAPGD